MIVLVENPIPWNSACYIMMVLVDGEQETEQEINLPGKYKETNNISNPCLGVFSFFQANFILVPFSTHRQQVPSMITVDRGSTSMINVSAELIDFGV